MFFVLAYDPTFRKGQLKEMRSFVQQSAAVREAERIRKEYPTFVEVSVYEATSRDDLKNRYPQYWMAMDKLVAQTRKQIAHAGIL